MKRNLYEKLLEWRKSVRRKPLLLKGARQTGKTYLLNEFGQKEYESCIYINFERDASAGDFFVDRLDPKELIKNLSIYVGQKIRPGRDLIVFDEIQASNRALNSLKYFQEQAPEYHIVAAGSLLGITLSGPGSFPVGKVNFLDLYPLSFFEFLEAVGAKELKELVQSRQTPEPYPEPLHKELLRQLRSYYFTGGMPEAVYYFASSGDWEEVREVHNEILGAYVLDFAKYAAGPDIPKLRMVWDSIPAQLSKENKKFIFSVLKKSARMRDFENAIQWLEKAGLIHRIFRVNTAKRPLKAYAEENIFKVYTLDTGLLGALAGIPARILVQGDRIFQEFKGALVENFVVQELKATRGLDLYYWESRGTAEVDFLCENFDAIFPLEAKAGINPHSKSLKSFDQKFHPPYLGRTSQLNFKQDGRLLNIPLYAVSLFPLPPRDG
ncbi:MAG: ATP-binding protein [Desulfobia sp.]